MPEISGGGAGDPVRVAVVVAEFNAAVTSGLRAGALRALAAAGIDDPLVVAVPGAFELPVVAARLARSGFDAIVALGAVIEGETDHYEHVATQSIAGLQQVAVTTGVPIGLGVLTVRHAEQAMERSRPGPGNKGAEAAEAALRTARALREIDRLP
jgi:6,7-dimethyl-8-ribityllumazine synthase